MAAATETDFVIVVGFLECYEYEAIFMPSTGLFGLQ